MKKKNVVVFNIGHRDLEFTELINVKGRAITKYLPKDDGDNFRDYSKYVLEHYDEYAAVIKFPLIEKTLHYLGVTLELKLNTIYLCASDQAPSALHHITDTVYVTHIFKKYMNDLRRHKNWSKILDEMETPKIIPTNQSPADLDIMNQFYDNFFGQLSKRSQFDKVYISTTGGTPAMNNMAWFNGIKYFQDRVECVYLPNRHQSPRMLNIGRKVVQETYIGIVKENIRVYEYFAASRFLESVAEKFPDKSVIRTVNYLLKYCHHRLSFDFEEAIKMVSKIEHEQLLVEFGDQIYVLKDEIYHMTEDNQAVKEVIKDYMLELYWNTYILFNKGQYIDVCGRVFRFQEQALNYLITEVFGVPVKDKKFIDQSWIKDQSGLIDYIKASGRKEIPINYKGELNRNIMRVVSEYYISHGAEKYQETLQTIMSFDELADIRNQSPMAHGFKGVSEKKLFEKVRNKWELKEERELGARLFQNMRYIYRSIFGIDKRLERNVYQEINGIILQLLSKLA